MTCLFNLLFKIGKCLFFDREAQTYLKIFTNRKMTFYISFRTDIESPEYITPVLELM